MATITLNGVQLYYEIHGKGKPLVLIAGYTCDHSFWDSMLTELASRFQVIIFDNRGIGQSQDNDRPFTLDDLADDAIALIKHLGFKQVNLLGQSMGGAIAQIVAKKAPELIEHLIIVNSAAKFNRRTGEALQSLLKLRIAGVSFDLIFDAGLPWFWSSESLADPVMVENYRESIRNYPYPQSLENQQRQFSAVKTFDSLDWVKQIKIPTLVIAALEDIVVLPSESKALADALPNAEFRMIPKGHSSPIETAEIVNKMIVEFLLEEKRIVY